MNPEPFDPTPNGQQAAYVALMVAARNIKAAIGHLEHSDLSAARRLLMAHTAVMEIVNDRRGR